MISKKEYQDSVRHISETMTPEQLNKEWEKLTIEEERTKMVLTHKTMVENGMLVRPAYIVCKGSEEPYVSMFKVVPEIYDGVIDENISYHTEFVYFAINFFELNNWLAYEAMDNTERDNFMERIFMDEEVLIPLNAEQLLRIQDKVVLTEYRPTFDITDGWLVINPQNRRKSDEVKDLEEIHLLELPDDED